MSTEERFMAFVYHADNGCWLWAGGKDRDGYGMFWHNDRTGRATHVALEVIKCERRQSAQLQALHSCDNSQCVNPQHLSWGTAKENTKQAFDRGLRTKQIPPVHLGEKHPGSILCAELVHQIRALFVPGVYGARRIAKKLGINQSTVSDVVAGRTWRHVHAVG